MSSTLYADEPVTFEAVVHDTEDPASSLAVTWRSSVDGELFVEPVFQGDGRVVVEGWLAAGDHELSVSVTDSAGDADTDQVDVRVFATNALPECELIFPVDGQVVATGEPLELLGTATDANVAPERLRVIFSSHQDGVIGAEVPDALGWVSETWSAPAPGIHLLTMTAIDERDAVCVQTIEVTASTPPMLVIVSPSDGDRIGLDEGVTLSGTAADPEHPAALLQMAWSSDIDGPLPAPGINTVGSFWSAAHLTSGDHVLTAMVSDPDGLTASQRVSVRVNHVPVPPVVTIAPNPAWTDDPLSAEVLVDATDPEGDPVTLSWAWKRVGPDEPIMWTGSMLPVAYTTGGDVWEIHAVPFDGFDYGDSAVATLVIGNTPPQVGDVQVQTSGLTTDGETLACAADNVVDLDGDLVELAWSWVVDGVDLGLDAEQLDPSWIEVGSLVQCGATPTDGQDWGSAVWSEVVEIVAPTLENWVTWCPEVVDSPEDLSEFNVRGYDVQEDLGVRPLYQHLRERALQYVGSCADDCEMFEDCEVIDCPASGGVVSYSTSYIEFPWYNDWYDWERNDLWVVTFASGATFELSVASEGLSTTDSQSSSTSFTSAWTGVISSSLPDEEQVQGTFSSWGDDDFRTGNTASWTSATCAWTWWSEDWDATLGFRVELLEPEPHVLEVEDLWSYAEATLDGGPVSVVDPQTWGPIP